MSQSRRLLSLTDVRTNFTLIIRYTILIFLAITVTVYDEFYIQFVLVIKNQFEQLLYLFVMPLRKWAISLWPFSSAMSSGKRDSFL